MKDNEINKKLGMVSETKLREKHQIKVKAPQAIRRNSVGSVSGNNGPNSLSTSRDSEKSSRDSIGSRSPERVDPYEEAPKVIW